MKIIATRVAQLPEGSFHPGVRVFATTEDGQEHALHDVPEGARLSTQWILGLDLETARTLLRDLPPV